MTRSFSEAKAEDTICYKCSSKCFRCSSKCLECLSSSFSACGRHKKRTANITLAIVSFVGCLATHIYIWINVDSSLDDKFLVLCLIYGACSFISVFISWGLTLPDPNDNDINPENFPMICWEKFIRLVSPNDEIDWDDDDDDMIIFYNFIQHVYLNLPILTGILLALYLIDAIQDEWELVSLGLIGMVKVILMIAYYIVFVICWVIYLCVGKCCIEPYYGYKEYRTRGRETNRTQEV